MCTSKTVFCRCVLSLKSDPQLPKFYLFQWKPSKSNEKDFLFHLKTSFRFQDFKFLSWLFGHVEKKDLKKYKVDFRIYVLKKDIRIFVLAWLAMWKKSLIRKFRLISKSMTSQTGKEAIAIHIYTYCLISQEVKVIRQWNLVS